MSGMREHAFFPHLIELGKSRNRARRWLSIFRWFSCYRERVLLRDLSDDTLRDCDLSRADIENEITKLR
jgi:uncharacterized protein YjiS (DUF1127 family)